MRALFASVAAGLLYGLIFPPAGLSALSWVGLAPLAWALRGRSLAATAGLAFLFALVGTASVVPWLVPTLHHHFGQSWGASIAFWLLVSAISLAPYYAVLLAAGSWAARRLPPAATPLLFACAWTGAEWCRTQIGLRSPWMRLGDAHFASLHLRQVADLFGVYGLSFLLAYSNGVVAEAGVGLAGRLRGRRVSLRALAWNAGACGALVAAALGYGAQRLADLDTGGSGFEVALVQGNVDAELRWRRSRASQVLQRYGGLTRDLLDAREAGPDLVVWPENALQTQVDDPVYGPPLLRLSARTPLLVGAPRSEAANGGRHSFNSVFLLEGGVARGHYDKRRLLPFSETLPLGGFWALGGSGDLDAVLYTPGEAARLFEVAGERLAPLLCMEALYPEFAREAVRGGATVLANLSNDGWFRGRGGPEQHLAMATFRAIETRRPVLRATTRGISAVIAPDGSTLARLATGVSGVLHVELPRAQEEATLYTRSGDAFAVGCLCVVAVATLAAGRRSLAPPQASTGVAESIPPRTSA